MTQTIYQVDSLISKSSTGINIRTIFRSKLFIACRILGFHSGGYEENHFLGYNAV
jgi:hypothetical protein